MTANALETAFVEQLGRVDRMGLGAAKEHMRSELDPDESVDALLSGNFGRARALLVVTDRGVLVTTRSELKRLPYEEITDVVEPVQLNAEGRSDAQR